MDATHQEDVPVPVVVVVVVPVVFIPMAEFLVVLVAGVLDYLGKALVVLAVLETHLFLWAAEQVHVVGPEHLYHMATVVVVWVPIMAAVAAVAELVVLEEPVEVVPLELCGPVTLVHSHQHALDRLNLNGVKDEFIH